MTIEEKMGKQECFFQSAEDKYRTEPFGEDEFKGFKKTPTGEAEVPYSDKGLNEAIVSGEEITEEEYLMNEKTPE